jgi:hypothetical protein
MKLRTTALSIRLRLSQTDLRNFAERGVVEETLGVDPDSNQRFTYRLARTSEAEEVRASIADNTLTVFVPADRADQWTSTDIVGIDNSESDAAVRILVEKDFACLVPRGGEDDRDTFPHPRAGENC